MGKTSSLIRFCLLLMLFGLVILWWRNLPEHARTFWRNFFRQLPDLPGRYMA